MSEKKEIKSGDVVQLISGGPDMTVIKVADTVSGSKNVHCVWYNVNTNCYNESTFDIQVVKLL